MGSKIVNTRGGNDVDTWTYDGVDVATDPPVGIAAGGIQDLPDPPPSPFGWWNGMMACSTCDAKAWHSRVELRSHELPHAMVCPYCLDRTAHPSQYWRTSVYECPSCGVVELATLTCPCSAWDTENDCFSCGETIHMPSPAANETTFSSQGSPSG